VSEIILLNIIKIC